MKSFIAIFLFSVSLAFGQYSPPTIAAGSSPSFTNITATGTLSVTGQTRPAGGIRGETSNGSATAGNIGEFISGSVAFGSAISLTNNTAANLTSISLTAGDWDVCYDALFNVGTVTITVLRTEISATSAAFDGVNGNGIIQSYAFAGLTGTLTHSKSVQRISLSATTTIYCVVYASFSLGTVSVYGQLRARRSANAK